MKLTSVLGRTLRRRKILAHALLMAACVLALSRPQRLLSAASPALETRQAAVVLSGLANPRFPSPDETMGAQTVARIYALRGLRHTAARIERGDNLGQLLRQAGASPEETTRFIQALRPVFKPRRARAGHTYEVVVDSEGRIREFTYRTSPLEIYEASAQGEDWRVARVDVPVERREMEFGGVLSGSLYGSFLAAGADAELVTAFADLFRWDVDFATEAREGDRFRVIYEELFARGEPAGHGRILAASYRQDDHEHMAVFYKSEGVEGYFDANGKNVKKSFLRAPLRFSYISSRFSTARRHPVLDVVRPHRGVDYAAPAGTPVWSVSEGRVADMGWKGGAGRSITIRHARGYETLYNHLSRYAKGLRAGGRVKQGQVIGYVGATGLATGPHLDYRVKKDGQWVNPLRQKFLPADPVPAGEAAAYREWSQAWLARLDGVSEGISLAQR